MESKRTFQNPVELTDDLRQIVVPEEVERYRSYFRRLSGECHVRGRKPHNPACMGMFQQRYVKRHKIWHKPHINSEMWLFCAFQNQTAFRRPILGA